MLSGKIWCLISDTDLNLLALELNKAMEVGAEDKGRRQGMEGEEVI